MIYIRGFGWRLGNQMFQIASAIGLAEQNNDRVWYPEWSYAKDFIGDFSNPEGLSPAPTRLFKENGHHYTKIPYVKNMVIEGYFQSDKYFAHCEDKIKEMFTTKVSFDRPTEPCCSVHIRLGDYVNLPNHHPVKTYDNYYGMAMEKYERELGFADPLYVVFSDDISRVKETFPTQKHRCVFIDEPNEINAFSRMSRCDDHIIGNSTYSWWAAYVNINPNKIVVAPKEWFGPAYSHLNLKDLFPQGWIVV